MTWSYRPRSGSSRPTAKPPARHRRSLQPHRSPRARQCRWPRRRPRWPRCGNFDIIMTHHYDPHGCTRARQRRRHRCAMVCITLSGTSRWLADACVPHPSMTHQSRQNKIKVPPPPPPPPPPITPSSTSGAAGRPPRQGPGTEDAERRGRQARGFLGPGLTLRVTVSILGLFPSTTPAPARRPPHAVGWALLSARAYLMWIGACLPMVPHGRFTGSRLGSRQWTRSPAMTMTMTTTSTRRPPQSPR